MLIYTGRTVYVVPSEQSTWSVVDLERHGRSFPTKAAALDYAKQIADANHPSQVVLFDAFGNMQPIAHYQLPTYPLPLARDENGGSVFEATVKALVIGGLAAAGVAVLGDLVERVEREARQESAKSRRVTKTSRRSRRA